MKQVTIDAKGKVLGRLATEIANVLRGKNSPSFRPDRLPDVEVTVTNANQYRVTGRKSVQKMYYHFSGYPGGLNATAMRDVAAAKPDQILTLAVKRMLPKNKLQAQFMKRLHLTMSDKS